MRRLHVRQAWQRVTVPPEHRRAGSGRMRFSAQITITYRSTARKGYSRPRSYVRSRELERVLSRASHLCGRRGPFRARFRPPLRPAAVRREEGLRRCGIPQKAQNLSHSTAFVRSQAWVVSHARTALRIDLLARPLRYLRGGSGLRRGSLLGRRPPSESNIA